ncbi:hypothetical protein HN588_13340 [Candidatus Bathyarchaeota archaeon]|jgi:hypothetical protein|nr:hypothetical protein [Candidatus Bathyarchaeota archaeon]
MAKMTRGALKGLVKECLIEILAEGIASSPEALTESVSAVDTRSAQRGPGLGLSEALHRPRSAALDTPRQVANPNFDRNVEAAVNQITSDPILQEILSDTARGSLQNLGGQDSSMGSNVLAGAMGRPSPTAGPTMNGDPAQVFDQIAPGASDKWAHLAFASKKNHLPGQ